jgi:hypothetical protein
MGAGFETVHMIGEREEGLKDIAEMVVVFAVVALVAILAAVIRMEELSGEVNVLVNRILD